MHPDMLLLTERLVVAMERMSEDVKNISVCINDVSYCVQQFFNEKMKTNGDSQLASDGNDNPQLSSSAAAPKAPGRREYSRQYEQAEGRPMSHIDNMEHEDISVQAFASVCMESSNALPPLPVQIKTELQPEGEADDRSFDLCDAGDDIRSMRGIAEVVKDDANVNEFWFPMQEESAVHLPIPTQDRVSSIQTTIHPAAESGVVRTRKLESVFHQNMAEKPFRCTICNKTFSSKSSVLLHMKGHSNEKPFQCPGCEKTFHRRDCLQKHMRLHSGEKPYVCKVCGKAFTQNAHLTGHMRCHTREKPCRCTVCGKVFTESSTLARHMCVHVGEQPFACEDCGSSFAQWDALQSHRLSVHGGPSADS